MKISYAKGRSGGVSTLMYVGDDDTGQVAGPSHVELGAGVIGALVALCASHPLTKIAAAAVAGYVGFDVYQARK